MRKVSEQYGVLITQMGVANRATFVIDKDGKIANIEEGSGAIDTAGADWFRSMMRAPPVVLF